MNTIKKNVLKRIYKESLRTSNFIDLNNEIKWVKDIRNLSEELKTVIQKFLDENDVHQGDCHLNSLKLSTFHPKIRRVVGFLGTKFNKEDYLFLKSNKNLKKLPNGLFETTMNLSNGDCIKTLYDIGKEVRYSPHSWNEFEGIHFDITLFTQNDLFKCLNEIGVKKFHKKWMFYFESSKVDVKKMKSTKYNVFSYLRYILDNYPKSGLLMNRYSLDINKGGIGFHHSLPNKVIL